MEPTVLAGPVEFSPAEIALIVAVLAAMFVAVMAPGWAVLALRRPPPPQGPAARPRLGRRPCSARIGGLVVCVGVAVADRVRCCTSVGHRSAASSASLAAWAACWAIAYAHQRRRSTFRGRRRASPASPARPAQPTSEGWGR